jgi:DNA transformation protein
MAQSPSDRFVEHALDLFSTLGLPVSARRMFGGLGFYAGGLFFAIGDHEEGRLWLKVDEESRAAFEAAGGSPFTYTMPQREVMTMASYLSPPDAALEDPEAMLPWATLGVEAARRAAAAKAARSKPKSKANPKAKATAPRARGAAGSARGRKVKRPGRSGR